MGRFVVAVIAWFVGLGLLLVVSPFPLIGALALLLLAWRRPMLVGRLSKNPRLAALPVSTRATPVRFALTATVLTLALTTGSVAMAGSRGDGTPRPSATDAPAAPGRTLGPTEEPTSPPSSTPRITPQPTASPTPVATPVFGEEPTGPVQVATVTRVIDGDTIEVRLAGRLVRVRYIGMDAPETSGAGEWMAAQATKANGSLVSGMKVRLEKDVSETDRYGRLLRYVWIERESRLLLVNRELLVLGVAQVATFPPDVKYTEALFLPAEVEARDSGRGLWGPAPTPRPTPRATPRPTPRPTARPASNCHPSYKGACLKMGIGDYDCAGGSGNGPNYTGLVRVVGWDEFGLDRDNDGYGCE